MGSPPVSKLKTEIAVLEGIIREKKEQLRITEAIENRKTICGVSMWRRSVLRRQKIEKRMISNNVGVGIEKVVTK